MACASLLILGACASGPAGDGLRGSAALGSDAPSAPAYGLYLAGVAAQNAGDNAGAANYFTAVASRTNDVEITEQALYTSVMAGDLERAARLAPAAAHGAPGAQRLSRLVTAVDALADGRGKVALAALSGEPVGVPHRSAAALIKPFAAAAAGDWSTATAEPDFKTDRIAQAVGTLGRAQLLERAKRLAEAEAVLSALSKQDSGALQAYGEFLERRGRRDEAVVVFDRALVGSSNEAGLIEARKRAKAGRPAPALPELRAGAAEAMRGAAAGAVLLRRPDLGLAYLRLALRLDPSNQQSWLMVGDLLAGSGEGEAARSAYQKIKTGSPLFVDARTRAVWTYQDANEQPIALQLARDTVQQAPDSLLAKTTLAEALRVSGQYEESARVLDGVIASGGMHWRLYLMRALALERAGRWSDAERDLVEGLLLNPDEPEMLNQLGYAWIDRGVRLEEALTMVQKAAKAEPNSGAVVDSLGWAYYRLGQYPKAVEHLERATQLEPSDPEINTHLGDAYWQTGRHIEAEFQWRKVLTTMKPDARLRTELETRLKSGAPAQGRSAAKVAIQ